MKKAKRVLATVLAMAGCAQLIAMAGILFSREEGNKMALLILLPVPVLLLLISFLLFRSAKKQERLENSKVSGGENKKAATDRDEMQENNRPDWKDDSGEIHTVKYQYSQSEEDGWQQNKALYGSHLNTSKTRNIKGKQVGFYYATDDYRKVITGYVIGTVFAVLFSIIMLIIVPVMGILITIFSLVFIVSLWVKAPYKKWKNQADKLKQEKKNNDF
ncbi:MAG: hypothetical protein ACI4TB_05050 [Lachnospiraceae bacterium]